MPEIKRRDPDEERLVGLVARYGSPIRSFIARRVQSAADVNDLSQEVFLRLMRRSTSGPIENVEGYLFQIAANLLRERGRQDALRASAPAVELDPEMLGQGEEHSPERILLGKEACRQMIAALYELPERPRTIFMLNRFENVKGAEIARMLGISISAVEKNLVRALQHLKARVK
jgi:RNA polymerase sigma factor (sigma-70 family)